MTALAGCTSGRRDGNGSDDPEQSESTPEHDGTATDEHSTPDEVDVGIGSWSLTVFHEPDRTPDEVDAVASSDPLLDDQLLQELFDEAVATGRAAYSTRDEEVAAEIRERVTALPETDDLAARFVIHDGEVLRLRFLQLH